MENETDLKVNSMGSNNGEEYNNNIFIYVVFVMAQGWRSASKNTTIKWFYGGMNMAIYERA